MLWKNIIAIAFGFSSGAVIAGAVFAFIAIIGIVPRLAQKTRTEDKIIFYEECIIVGGILGTIASIVEVSMPIGSVGIVILGFCAGVFTGCLAMCLAEMLDVIPVLLRRVRLEKGMAFFILSIAMGKLIGSLVYFITNDFHNSPG